MQGLETEASEMKAAVRCRRVFEPDKYLQAEKAQKELTDEQILRKKLRNELEDLKGKIRVYCRCVPTTQYLALSVRYSCRPMSSKEIKEATGECVRFPDRYTIMVNTRLLLV